jgi:ferredoxin
MRRSLTALAVCGLALTACGSGSDEPKQPAMAAFADGTCRVAAPDVLAIGKAGLRIDKSKKVDAETRTALREAQAALRDLATAAEPSYQPSLDALVVSAGFVRIRADGNTFEPAVGEQLMKDYRAVLKACGAD